MGCPSPKPQDSKRPSPDSLGEQNRSTKEYHPS
jgi:hypothetical protein